MVTEVPVKSSGDVVTPWISTHLRQLEPKLGRKETMLKNTDLSRGRHCFGKTECSANTTKPINMTIFHIRGWMSCRSISLCIAQLIRRQLCTLYVISQPKFIKPSIKEFEGASLLQAQIQQETQKKQTQDFLEIYLSLLHDMGVYHIEMLPPVRMQYFGWSSPPPVALKVEYLYKIHRVCPVKINVVVVSFRSLVNWKCKGEFHCSRSSWIIVTCSSRP